MAGYIAPSIAYLINESFRQGEFRLKLESAGVSGSAFHWFKSYLDNSRQYVTCDSTESNSLALRHGVPQGSVLGPTLFCAHYNDVASAVKHSSCTLFADDTEIHYSDGDIDKHQIVFMKILTTLAHGYQVIRWLYTQENQNS